METVRNAIALVSVFVIPLILVGFPLNGLAKRVPVYDTFVEGAKEGFQVAVRHPGLPVLFMSAYAEDDVTRSLLPEQSTYIQKPFAPDTLVAQVRAGLAGVMPGAL
jgi:hypothetical protein